jgi:hypothetical protein
MSGLKMFDVNVVDVDCEPICRFQASLRRFFNKRKTRVVSGAGLCCFEIVVKSRLTAPISDRRAHARRCRSGCGEGTHLIIDNGNRAIMSMSFFSKNILSLATTSYIFIVLEIVNSK